MTNELKGYIVYSKETKVWISSVDPLAITRNSKDALVFETKESAKFHADLWAFDVRTIKRSTLTQAEFEEMDKNKKEIWD